MKILFVDTYYPKFLENFRKNNQDVVGSDYDAYKGRLLSTCFGTSDFYSYNFNKLGWRAEDVIVNDEILQKKWAAKNDVKVTGNSFVSKLQSLPYMYRLFGKPTWVQEIALAQINKYKPDIVYMQDLSILNPETLREVKSNCKLLVGQIASPPPPEEYLKCIYMFCFLRIK